MNGANKGVGVRFFEIDDSQDFNNAAISGFILPYLNGGFYGSDSSRNICVQTKSIHVRRCVESCLSQDGANFVIDLRLDGPDACDGPLKEWLLRKQVVTKSKSTCRMKIRVLTPRINGFFLKVKASIYVN